ncbi:MAG: hypothetical protein WBF53_15395 [Litorimonas sp.]
MKKTVLSGLTLLALGVAAPAVACEFHGAGWTPTSSWQNFSPIGSFQDSFENGEYSDLGNSFSAPETRAVPPQRVKPSFSNAADRAARRAKTLLAMKDGSDERRAPKASLSDTQLVPTDGSEADAETVREASP